MNSLCSNGIPNPVAENMPQMIIIGGRICHGMVLEQRNKSKYSIITYSCMATPAAVSGSNIFVPT
jgi:hypothetical protein